MRRSDDVSGRDHLYEKTVFVLSLSYVGPEPGLVK